MDFVPAGRLLAACAVIALVLWAVAAAARASSRYGLRSGGRGKLLGLLETTHLPDGSSLHVVRAAERYYVIGRSATHIATLCEIPAESVAKAFERPTAAVAPRSLGARLGLSHRI